MNSEVTSQCCISSKIQDRNCKSSVLVIIITKYQYKSRDQDKETVIYILLW